MQRKFSSITRSSVRFLGEKLQRMGNQFLSSLEVMTSCSQCPTVLLDAETVRLSDMETTLRCLRSYNNVGAVCRVVAAGLLRAVGDSEV